MAFLKDIGERDPMGLKIRKIIHKGSAFNLCKIFKSGRFAGPLRWLENSAYFPSLAFNYEPVTVYPDLGEPKLDLDVKGIFN